MTRKTSKTPANTGAENETTPAVAVPSIFDQYETDLIEQENGRWFRNIGLGINLKLRRFSSRVALNNMQRLQVAYRHLRVDGALPEEVADEMMAEHLGGCIIVDWDGPAFRNRDNTPLTYSVDTAIMLMKRLPELRNNIILHANNIDNFRITDRKDIEGN